MNRIGIEKATSFEVAFLILLPTVFANNPDLVKTQYTDKVFVGHVH